MRVAVALVAAIACGSCGTDELEPSSGTVATVEVAPPTASVAIGATVSLTASAFDADGNVLAGRKVLWASADSNFATVSSGGVVTGRYVGTVPIAASIDGKAAVARVEVMPLPVVAVRISPTSRDLTVGESVVLAAEPVDARGIVLRGRPVSWSSSRPNVASVNANGTVTAVSPGSAVITAAIDGKTGVAAITVSFAPVVSVAVSPGSVKLVVGQTGQLAAEPRDASGHPLSGRAVTWSSSRADVATVSSTGVVAAVAVGTATVTASSEGRSGAATVVVEAPAVSRVDVAPATAVVGIGGTFRLTATAYDSRGNVIPTATMAWTSSNTRIATVDNTGRVSGIAEGTAIVTATSGGRAGGSTVRVRR